MKSELIYAQNLDVDNNKENSSLSFHDTVRIAEPRAFASSFLLNTGQEISAQHLHELKFGQTRKICL